jgi:hypothetical protein
LNRLSALSSTCTRPGSASPRPSAVTATGSVLASSAPRTKAMDAGNGVSTVANTPTTAEEASTRPNANVVTGRHTVRRSRKDSSSAAAYSSGGRTTRLMVCGAMRRMGVPGMSATRRPARTSRDGAGIRQRRAPPATVVASTTRKRMVPTARIRQAPDPRSGLLPLVAAARPPRRPDFPAHRTTHFINNPPCPPRQPPRSITLCNCIITKSW